MKETLNFIFFISRVISLKPLYISSKVAKTPSTGKLDANMHLLYPKMFIASRIICLLRLIVHF